MRHLQCYVIIKLALPDTLLVTLQTITLLNIESIDTPKFY